MIKTITANNPADLDRAVNDFEKKCAYDTGVSRVFATQTHVTYIGVGPIAYKMQYTAVIFYKGAEVVEDVD